MVDTQRRSGDCGPTGGGGRMATPLYDALEARDPALREAALMAALPALVAAAKERCPAYRLLLAAIPAEDVTDRRALAGLPAMESASLKAAKFS